MVKTRLENLIRCYGKSRFTSPNHPSPRSNNRLHLSRSTLIKHAIIPELAAMDKMHQLDRFLEIEADFIEK